MIENRRLPCETFEELVDLLGGDGQAREAAVATWRSWHYEPPQEPEALVAYALHWSRFEHEMRFLNSRRSDELEGISDEEWRLEADRITREFYAGDVWSR